MKTIPWEVNSSKFSDSYVAGFLDGDGSIVATVERRPERRRFPYRIRLKINFTQHMRHYDMLVKLQQFLDGYGSLREIRSHNLVELVIQDRNEVKAVLKRLLPYLILKERQAKIMIAIIDIYDAAKVNVRSSISEKEFKKILALVREIRNINSGTGGKRTI
jgi:hypothetical protein